MVLTGGRNCDKYCSSQPTSRLTVSGSPIVSSGTIALDLATSGVTAGAYAQANVTVDAYGRITTIANGTAGGTVTSVGLNSKHWYLSIRWSNYYNGNIQLLTLV